MWLKRLIERQAATDDGTLRSVERDSTGIKSPYPWGYGATTTIGPNLIDPETREDESSRPLRMRKGKKRVHKKNK